MARWTLVAVMAVVMWTVAAVAQDRPARVGVDAVRVEPLSQTVPILGRLVANQRGEVAARVAGAVQRLEVQVGDRLDAGSLIALVDVARLQANAQLARARVLAAEAQVAADRAELSLLEQERERLARLRASAAFSPAALEDKTQEIQAATARIARAEAQFDEASAELILAERDLADASIVAPYPGVVTQRYVSAGDYVQTGEPVVSLVDDSTLEIEADVPSSQARALQSASELDIVFDDGSSASGIVRAIVPDENPLTRTLAVRVAIDDAALDRFLASGQSVTLEVPIGARTDVVTVDKDAVLRRADEAIVYLAEDGAATPRTVTLGEAVGQRFVVRDGLVPGELVIVRGNERLRPGQAIEYAQPETAAQPAGSGSAS